MLTLTLPPELEHALAQVATRSGRPSARIAEDAALRAVEDWGDCLEALEAAHHDDPATRVSQADMMRPYGLAD